MYGFSALGQPVNVLGIIVPTIEAATGLPWEHEAERRGDKVEKLDILGVFCTPATAASRVYGNEGAEFTVVTEALADPGPVVGTCPVCHDALHGTACAFCHVNPRTSEESTA